MRWAEQCLPRVSVHSVQKDGNREDENEDAFAATELRQMESHLEFRAAVADGASSGYASGVLACSVAQAAARAGCIGTRSLEEKCSRLWLGLARQILEGASSWNQRRAAERFGAATTLLVLRVVLPRRSSLRGKWTAVACGDSQLFQMRRGRVRKSFPLGQDDREGAPPALLVGRLDGRAPQFRVGGWKVAHGEWEVNDTFVLTTDALAFWALRSADPSKRVLELIEVAGAGIFQQWVVAQRIERRLTNDDSTLGIVTLGVRGGE